MPKIQRKPLLEEKTIPTGSRWEVTIYYLNMLGVRASTQRRFAQRVDAELAIRSYLTSGITILGDTVIHVVPPHQIQGITYYDALEGKDADPPR